MEKLRELINFEPTELQKEKVNDVCSVVIDCMTNLTVQEKALTLKTLVDAFEEVVLKGEYLE